MPFLRILFLIFLKLSKFIRNVFHSLEIVTIYRSIRVVLVGLFALIIAGLLNRYYKLPLQYRVCPSAYWSVTLDTGFEGFDNESGIVNGPYIVPNYIHFLRYGSRKLENVNFMDAVNILSAFKNQKPDKIFFHTDLGKFTGKYWDILMQVPGFKDVVEFPSIKPVDSIFGQPLNSWYKLWHGSDILRIDILRRYGGIFIDNDVYVVKKLDEFRRFEMTLEIIDEKSFGTMTLVAHKDARFLKLWHDSYKWYLGHLWYYNAGEKPKIEILNARPELVHNVQDKFGVRDLRVPLYIEKWKDWKSQFTIHTLVRHLHDLSALQNNKLNLTYPVTFDEKIIFKYNVTILDMILDCCKELLT
ncbi:hypothetical protein PGB90_005933 [Kerria lacca]